MCHVLASALPFCVCGSCRNMVPVGRSLFHLKVSCILQIGVAMGLTLVCFVAVHLQSSGRRSGAVALEGAWDILGSLEKSMDKRIDDKVQSFMQGPAEATIPVIFRST